MKNRGYEEITSEISKLYKERTSILQNINRELIGKAFKVNESYYHIIEFEKENAKMLCISDANVTVEILPIKQVAQWTEEIDDFKDLLQQTHEFQIQSIGGME